MLFKGAQWWWMLFLVLPCNSFLQVEDDSDYEPTDDDIPDDADVDEDNFDEEEIPSPEMPAEETSNQIS